MMAGLLPANDGWYRKWPDPGMFFGMPINSNEYEYTYMEHGSDDGYPYRGGLHAFVPLVDKALQKQVNHCSRTRGDPAGCQMAGVQQVFSAIEKRIPLRTPHPYRLSYETGFSPMMAAIPPLPRSYDN